VAINILDLEKLLTYDKPVYWYQSQHKGCGISTFKDPIVGEENPAEADFP